MARGSRGRAAAVALRHAAGAVSAFYLALVAWLGAIALLPALLGWTPYVITTGSMAPRIPAGTVLVASPPPDETVAPGGVIVFADASGRTITHRVVEVDEAGRYRTRGDANPTPDPAPVDPRHVRGVGRVVVPLIGLPVVWALEGRWSLVALAAVSAAAACWAGWGSLRRRPAARPAGAATGAGRGSGPEGGSRKTPAVAGVVTAVALVGTVVALAGASFVSAATQPSNRWSAASAFGGLLAVTASDLPAGATEATQVFTFVPGSALPAGATVAIDLTEAFQGPVDYRRAGEPAASVGSATLEQWRGNSPQREAWVAWVAPPGGLAAGVEVTITLPGGIETAAGEHEGLPAVARRDDTGDTLTALFAVR